MRTCHIQLQESRSSNSLGALWELRNGMNGDAWVGGSRVQDTAVWALGAWDQGAGRSDNWVAGACGRVSPAEFPGFVWNGTFPLALAKQPTCRALVGGRCLFAAVKERAALLVDWRWRSMDHQLRGWWVDVGRQNMSI